MKLGKIWILSLVIAGVLAPSVSAQKYTRAKAVGLRGSFWKSQNRLTSINVGGSVTPDVSLDLSGLGGALYFVSRASDRFYFETSLGAAGNIKVQSRAFAGNDVDFSGILPLLLGLRYELLSSLHESPMRPYLSVGGGPYWLATGVVEADSLRVDDNVRVETDFNLGYYAGGGMNFFLASWLALNFDFRYHFIEFSRAAGSPVDDYSGLEFGLGFGVHWGRKQDLFRLEGTRVVVEDLYPAYHQFYSSYPVALVSVRNLSGRTIEVNVRSTLKGYSERPHASGYIRLRKKEVRDIPVKVLLGRSFLDADRREPAILDIVVEAQTGENRRRTSSAQLLVHSRNAWNGDIDKLGYFVTTDDADVLALSREIASGLAEGHKVPERNYLVARAIFEALSARGLRYYADPNLPFYQDDRVQYALETLDLGMGDCDDLVVLYASLLESAGIRTAFVDVQPPDAETAHLYMLFDSGVGPESVHLFTNNEKKVVLRTGRTGRQSAWIPVETTAIEDGFDEGWKQGAMQYLEEAILANGIAEGWIRVIDLN